MKSFVAIALFALGCNAACLGAKRNDQGHMSALCTDDSTGIDFEYIDTEDKLSSVAVDKLPAVMYSLYTNGVEPNNTSTRLARRSLTKYWNQCGDQVSGVCADDHAIDSKESLQTFANHVYGLISAVNRSNRLDSAPRSVCNNYDGVKYCVSWAAYYNNPMSTTQIKAIANNCAQECEQQHDSCEAKVIASGQTEYWCVSNRATHCSANGKIKTC